MRIPPLARALLAIAASHSCACAQSHIHASVFNYAGAPGWMLTEAAETARLALLGVHIESRWVICEPDACLQDNSSGLSIEVYVMPRSRTQRTDCRDLHTAGYAMPDGFAHPRVYAFYDAARMVADRTTRPVSLVLGCIFLHETGHLLGLSHQPRGVMRANLDGDEMDYAAMGRAFNSDEGERLRAALDPALHLRAVAHR